MLLDLLDLLDKYYYLLLTFLLQSYFKICLKFFCPMTTFIAENIPSMEEIVHYLSTVEKKYRSPFLFSLKEYAANVGDSLFSFFLVSLSSILFFLIIFSMIQKKNKLDSQDSLIKKTRSFAFLVLNTFISYLPIYLVGKFFIYKFPNILDSSDPSRISYSTDQYLFLLIFLCFVAFIYSVFDNSIDYDFILNIKNIKIVGILFLILGFIDQLIFYKNLTQQIVLVIFLAFICIFICLYLSILFYSLSSNMIKRARSTINKDKKQDDMYELDNTGAYIYLNLPSVA